MHEKLKEILIDACTAAGYETNIDEISSSIIEAKPEFGDYASTIAFTIAKRIGKSPADVAIAIKNAIKMDRSLKTLIEKIEVAGPYINFTFSNKFYVQLLEDILAKAQDYGRGEDKGKKVVIEFPSVNPNKPWHVGHLRNALLGNSIANILAFAGYNVERHNYINDLGLQVAQSIWGYMTLSTPSTPQGVEHIEKFDHLLGLQYVEISKQAEKIEPEVRGLMKKLEAREPTVSARAREICERCLQAQLQTAFSFDIYGNLLVWESDILSSGIFEKELERLKKSGVFEKVSEGEHAGCWVIKLDPSIFPSLKSDAKVIIRSDGTATYTAKDLIFQMWKFGIVDYHFKCKPFLKQPNGVQLFTTNSVKGKEMEFGKADIVINIIGSEQSYPQELIKYILKRMGYQQQADNYIHVAYEHVVSPTGAFSGRLGTWVGYTADELFDEAVKRSILEIEKRIEKSEIKGKEKEKIAKLVANAAIKFSFLKVAPSKQVVFDLDRAVSFEGDTGPYLQYAAVRASKIFKKFETAETETTEFEDVKNVNVKNVKDTKTKKTRTTAKLKIKVWKDYQFSATERALVKMLSKFPVLVQKAACDYQCYTITEYALDVADIFNRFYETVPVLKAEEKEQQTRLALVAATRTVMTNALKLLGIEVPEKM